MEAGTTMKKYLLFLLLKILNKYKNKKATSELKVAFV